MKPLRAAIIGLGFGAEFIPIYQRHPDAEMYAICQRNEESLNKIGDAFGVEKRYTRYEDVLADPDVDFVHINTPIGDHGRMSRMGLEAGKHVACTVPMATTLDECIAICKAAKSNGKQYMMMETVLFSREFLFVQQMKERGELGRIQFVRGSHQQDMSVGWPEYWWGFPPMHYATHAVSPLFMLAGAMPERVVCLGSGRIREEYIPRYNSPFAVESALFKLRDSDIACEATRSLYETVRQYRESFDVYGEKMSFEWEQVAGEHPVLHTGGEDTCRVQIPDFAHLLPEPIREFTTKGVYDLAENEHLSFFQGAGHGGSHPHLAHEFVRALVEDRAPKVDAPTSAAITAAGVLAHQSAMNGGEPIKIPDFTKV
ncbi:MAG: Gfo/Idh/MocA family oxidoreductase [Armatimonadaceae bacterium]